MSTFPSEPTRRGLLAAVLGGGTVALAGSPASSVLDGVAPLSGRAYRDTGDPSGTVDSQHGSATVTYDDYHTPHVDGEDERAAYFALGYAHAADRLFQMDVFRRTARARLAAVLGPFVAGRDVRNSELDFVTAAEATRETLAGTSVEPVLAAYADGVTAYLETEPPGFAFGLLDYDPDPWTVLDTVLVGQQLSWRITAGATAPLHDAVRRDAFDEETYRRLFRNEFHDGAPVLDRARGGDVHGVADAGASWTSRGSGDPPTDPAFADWLGRYDPPTGIGSNAWVVSGDHTASGRPVVCSDPHVALRAPPMWYEQRVTADGITTHGIAVPGVPFPLVGENDHGAWGMTNPNTADADLFTYEVSDDGQRYRYRGEWREFETTTKTVPVRAGEDRTVTAKKTVHGPFVSREVADERHHVAVRWPGFSDARLAQGVYEFTHATGLADFRAACRRHELPPLNFVYGDADGRTLFQLAGNVPARRIDGDLVPGGQVFDGSAGEAELDGFEPFGQSTWEDTIPFEDLPAVVDPEYAATANQRPTADPAYPIGIHTPGGYPPGIRARRIYEQLEAAAERGESVGAAAMRTLQTDAVSLLARDLVRFVVAARDRMPARVQPYVDALADWDYGMARDSEAALAYYEFLSAFHEATWRAAFEARGLEESYWPEPWVLAALPADSEFFDGDRAAVVADAMTAAVDRIEREDWTTYGDANRRTIRHWLGGLVDGLNYPAVPETGSGYTVNANYPTSGVSYRMVADQGTDALHTVLPGGNDGSPVSDHYHDQLSLWAADEYRRADRTPTGDPDISFQEVDE